MRRFLLLLAGLTLTSGAYAQTTTTTTATTPTTPDAAAATAAAASKATTTTTVIGADGKPVEQIGLDPKVKRDVNGKPIVEVPVVAQPSPEMSLRHDSAGGLRSDSALIGKAKTVATPVAAKPTTTTTTTTSPVPTMSITTTPAKTSGY